MAGTKQPLRCALVGAASAAAYATVHPRLPEARVVAVVDGDAKARGAAAKQLGAEQQAGTVDELLGGADAGTLDAVLVHGAPARRVATAAAALAAGKHVLLGLPGTATAAELHELVAAGSKAGVTLMLGETLRYLPSQQAIKERVDAGKLGAIGLVRAHCWMPGAKKDGASALAGAAARYLDLVTWLFGTLPTHVYGRSRGNGYLQVHLGFPRGGMAIVDVAAELPAGDGYRSVTVIGATGAAYADDHHNRQLLFSGGNPAAVETGEGHLDTLAELTELTAAVAARRAPAVTVGDGERALTVAAAAARSADSGAALQLQGDSYE